MACAPPHSEALIESSEALREMLLTLRRENAALRENGEHAQQLLDALDALLAVDLSDDPFARVLAALHKVFDFSLALILSERGVQGENALDCIAAEPDRLVGSRWPIGPLFRKVMSGRAVAAFSNADAQEWQGAAALGLNPAVPTLYVPMRTRERRGILILLRAAGAPDFDRSHVALARRFSLLMSHALAARVANQVAVESRRLLDLSERLRHSEQEAQRNAEELQRRTFHDQLTGLPNRALIQEIVENALRTRRRGSARPFALAFIDLDNFKQVNDFYSHAMGDQLLIAVAQRITATLRASDTLARISGDEFLLFIDPLADGELGALMKNLMAALKQPFSIEGHEIMTSASVGASIYPLHGDSYEELRRCADSAMYHAKGQRKGSVAYFDASMGTALSVRMDLEQRLRAAIRQKHFRAVYQPKVHLQSGRVLGFEALVRWVEPDGTVIMPGTFIELASELGLLDEITLFMLGEVARELPLLNERFGAHISMSLNVSALQVGDVGFMHRLIARIAGYGIARQFIVELTEDSLVAAHTFQSEVLPQLRALGVRVSIDDFGTGYSSLSVLSDITADEIKIDRAFITAIHERPRSQGILKTIESLCGALRISMVAEGPETRQEIDYLRSHTSIGCAQGYFFSKPRFAEDLHTTRFDTAAPPAGA